MSVTTIKKAESGRGYVTGRTLHTIARALDVDTRALYVTRSVAPRLNDEPQHQALAELRAAISPPVGLDTSPVCPDMSNGGDLEEIDGEVQHTERDYRGDRYDDVAEALPASCTRRIAPSRSTTTAKHTGYVRERCRWPVGTSRRSDSSTSR